MPPRFRDTPLRYQLVDYFSLYITITPLTMRPPQPLRISQPPIGYADEAAGNMSMSHAFFAAMPDVSLSLPLPPA